MSQMHLVYYLNDSEWIGMRSENLFVSRYTLVGLPKVTVFLQKKALGTFEPGEIQVVSQKGVLWLEICAAAPP